MLENVVKLDPYVQPCRKISISTWELNPRPLRPRIAKVKLTPVGLEPRKNFYQSNAVPFRYGNHYCEHAIYNYLYAVTNDVVQRGEFFKLHFLTLEYL